MFTALRSEEEEPEKLCSQHFVLDRRSLGIVLSALSLKRGRLGLMFSLLRLILKVAGINALRTTFWTGRAFE